MNCSIPKGTLPVTVNLDPTLFEPGLHTITIVANSTTGEVATFSYNFTVPDIIGSYFKFCIIIIDTFLCIKIDFRCIQLRGPGKTVVICKISKPDATSRCGLVGSFESTSVISLLTPQYFMGIQLNCKKYHLAFMLLIFFILLNCMYRWWYHSPITTNSSWNL